ncbi:hypothetical protein PTSG_01633 [Salpingoeca rosetta]|uniref:Uncharacterized protein n=1 Tax=Salpingoeca rosetta (strain ATCC 50818 / BSB-021) TaxID=946362 RepID=F2TYI1_SALR5|nr:uncharacterized protein PTSG_01633 [Salpingoeca rosetta]EGD78655.1 hypothetical protein PTSG_01633 [Salpingoeca rosetta]|eukprot:XP_004997613.1 hypothetical protein PTSG_01633 [Salpingoeca rosetta]
MPNQTEEDLALKKISPILQWWAESRRLLDETDQDNDDMQPTRARTMPAMHAEPEPERNSISSETESPARPVRRRSSLMLVGQRPSRGSLLDTTLTTSLQAGVGVQDSPQLPARGTALSSFRFPTVPSVSRLSEGEEDETEDTTAARADVRTDQRLFAQGQASTAKSRRQSGRSGRSVRSDRSVWSDRRGGGSDTRRRGEHRHRSSRVSRPRARRPVSEAPSQSPSLSPSGTSTHRRSPRVFIASRSPSPSPTYARVANLTPPNMAETLPHTASGPSMLSQTMGASVSSSVERTRTHHHHHRHHHSGGSASNSDSARHQYHEEPYPQHRHSQVPPPSQRQYQENTGTEKRERRRAKSAIPRFDSLSRKARKSDTRPVRVHLVNTSPRTSPFSNTLPAGSPQLFRSLQDLSHSP